MYEAQARITRGWALTEQGSVEEGITEMRQGITEYQQTATSLLRPQFLGLLSEALGKAGEFEAALGHLDEALRLAHRNGDALYLPELHRIRGELLLMQAKGEFNPRTVADAEECFRRSIKIAQRQEAKSWELRTTVSLARLYQSQNRTEEAREVLTAVFDWFTEGFETKDVREAKSLLDETAWISIQIADLRIYDLKSEICTEPKRDRYSFASINAFTISASMKLPLNSCTFPARSQTQQN